MNKIMVFLFMISMIFSQNSVCDGHCFSDQEVQALRKSILELENADCTNLEIITNLENQMYIYTQKSMNDSLWISLQKEKIDLLDERILLYGDLVKEVEPKWYENKWLWFGFGVIFTTQSVKLAGELAD